MQYMYMLAHESLPDIPRIALNVVVRIWWHLSVDPTSVFPIRGAAGDATACNQWHPLSKSTETFIHSPAAHPSFTTKFLLAGLMLPRCPQVVQPPSTQEFIRKRTEAAATCFRFFSLGAFIKAGLRRTGSSNRSVYIHRVD